MSYQIQKIEAVQNETGWGLIKSKRYLDEYNWDLTKALEQVESRMKQERKEAR